MKKHLIAFVAGVLITSLFAFHYAPPTPVNQSGMDPDKGLARVEKKSGKYVFLECEPVTEYDVAFDVKAAVAGAEVPADFVEVVLKKALKTGEKEHKDFDGVVIKSGQRSDIAIKFK